MKEAIQKAIEGGWLPEFFRKYDLNPKEVLEHIFDEYEPTSLAEIREDPLFWQALGKAMGWKERFTWWVGGEKVEDFDHYLFTDRKYFAMRSEPNSYALTPEWRFRWLQFTNHLAEGKDADSFFNELIN